MEEDIYLIIKNIVINSRNKTYHSINLIMIEAYYTIGKNIVIEEQNGKYRAEYGKQLIVELSIKLQKEFGKGFDERNLRNMRAFYLIFPNWNAVRSELTWTHYRLILKIETSDARDFYINEAINSNWSTRELDKQISSLLYERTLLSNKKLKNLNKKNKLKPISIIKDPYVLDFLDLKENSNFLEKDLENAIISKLQNFLLELGRGYAFIERQKRISVENEHYYIDLVFYNYLLKCFVIIDLKVGKLTHKDIGQIDFYVRYFDDKVKKYEDNPTLGIILCSQKSETIVKYSILNDKENLFASKYKLYLPTKKELDEKINF